MQMLASRNRYLIVLAILLLMVAACVKNKTLTPTQQVTLQVARSTAALAEVNKAVTIGVIELNKQKLISQPDTAAILAWNKIVAEGVKVCMATLQSNKTWPEKSKAVLAQLQLMDLPPPAKKLLASSSTDATVKAFISVLITVQTVISSIQAGVS